MKLTLPFPPSDLSPNVRMHWAPLSRVKAAYRWDCFYTARSQGAWPMDADTVPMTITFHPPNKRKRDRDNMIAAFKAGQDGLSDALAVDDANFVPTYAVGEPIKGGAVVIEVAE